MPKQSWAQIVSLIHERADHCCEYCRTCQRVFGQSMHIEHIDPFGDDDLENLCLSCPNCNFSKARATTALDPETREVMPLFNPRLQTWHDHFEWGEEGALVIGKTSTGRATVERLRMNIDRIVTARRIWMKAGEHPPA